MQNRERYPVLPPDFAIAVTAGENLIAGDIVSLINNSGAVTAVKSNLAVNTSPNGSESVFNSTTTTHISACAIDATRFVVVYISGNPKAIVGTISGSSISWGSPVTIEGVTAATGTAVCLINTDKAIAFYSNTSLGYKRACVLSFSTNTVTAGTPISWQTNNQGNYPSVCKLDTDKALVVAHDQGMDRGEACVITVSGTTPTAGTVANYTSTSAIPSHNSVISLSSTTAIVAFQDGGSGYHGRAQVLSISGATITAGTSYTFNSESTSYIAAVALTSTTAAIVYSDGTSISGKIATNSSGTLSYSSEVPIGTAASVSESSAFKISDTKILVIFKDDIAPSGKSSLCTISGTSLTAGTNYVFNAAGSATNKGCYLGDNKSAIVYKDVGNSDYGTAVINTWAAPDYSKVAGIAETNITSGQSGNILISGVSTKLSGLIPGSPYYLASDFTLTATPANLTGIHPVTASVVGAVRIGIATSATSLLLDIQYQNNKV